MCNCCCCCCFEECTRRFYRHATLLTSLAWLAVESYGEICFTSPHQHPSQTESQLNHGCCAGMSLDCGSLRSARRQSPAEMCDQWGKRVQMFVPAADAGLVWMICTCGTQSHCEFHDVLKHRQSGSRCSTVRPHRKSATSGNPICSRKTWRCTNPDPRRQDVFKSKNKPLLLDAGLGQPQTDMCSARGHCVPLPAPGPPSTKSTSAPCG